MFSGTTFSQIITIISAPLLTRVYSIENFGVFTYFFTLISVFAVVQSLKIQHSVVAEKDKVKSFHLLILCMLIVLVMTLLLYGIFSINSPLKNIFKDQQLLLYGVCISGALMALYDMGYNYLAKLGMFKELVGIKIGQSSAIIIMQVIFAVEGLVIFEIPFGGNGLIAGYICGQIISFFIMSIFLFKATLKFYKDLKKITFTYLSKLFKENKKFVLFSMPAELLNTLTYFLIIYFITEYFGVIYAGLYGLTQRVVMGPMNLISVSFLDVFKNSAAEELEKNNSVKDSFKMLFSVLSAISIMIFFFLMLTKNLFGIIFGPEWSAAGNIVFIMSPFFCIKFVASPLSYVFFILKKQEWDMIWQTGLFILTCTIFLLVGDLYSFENVITVFSLSFALYYLFNIYLSYKITQ